ncbi:retrotransposon protein, putative, ty1-copia subclass, partial [Tanacetum coccineum]
MLFTMRETYIDRNPKMALPVQNINHSAFRSMFEREKLSGTNFNDWLRRLKLVLRVEKKMFVIEQPIPPAPAANSEANVLAEWNTLYDAYKEELKSMFEKQAGVERFDLIQTFHACKHEEGKPVGAYVLKMKDYVEQLERLGYVLPQDLSVGLILNGLTSDFTRFVRNYNMHNMGKTIKANKKSLKAKGKVKANGKGKDKHGYISKPKNLKPTAKEHPAKDDTCHYCKEVGHWKRNCPVFLAALLKKKKQVGTASSSANEAETKSTRFDGAMVFVHKHVSRQGASYFITFTDDYSRYGYVYILKLKHEVFETFKVFKNEVENQLGKTIKAIRLDQGGEYISQEFKDYLKACGIIQQLTPPYKPQHNGMFKRRNQSATYILNMVPTKKVDKTPYESWYGKVPNLSYLKVWRCVVLVKRDTPDKLQQRSVKCIFIGYLKET